MRHLRGSDDLLITGLESESDFLAQMAEKERHLTDPDDIARLRAERDTRLQRFASLNEALAGRGL